MRANAGATESPYKFVFGDDYLRLPSSEQTWVIEPLIPVGGLVNIYGKPKEAKKSWMGINMALAITNGWETLLDRFPVRMWGPVIYLQVDTPRSLWLPRWQLMRSQGHDVSLVALADPELVPYPLDLLDEESDHAGILEDMVHRAFKGDTPLVVFIDTLRDVHSGDEDKSTVMRNVVAKLQTAFRGSAKALISHSRKGAGDGGAGGPPSGSDDTLMDENRGSGYVAGRMDTIIRLTPKYMSYQGRAVGKERMKIEFNPATGLFSAAYDPVVEKVKQLPGEGLSDRERARLVASDLHITEEAARGAIRRHRASTSKGQTKHG